MSISISQTDNVGLTVESDPNALKIANNLSDITNTATARTNLAIDANFVSLTGTQNVSGQKTLTAAFLGLGNSINASTYELGCGATISAVTKAVKVGTNGLAGSTTNITVGSTTGTSTTTLQGITNGVTQTVNDNSTKLVTTAGLRDMLSDCTWSAPPITTCLSGTSGTGASVTNASLDTNWTQGPNVNIAGYAQKGMQMFARSNSSYGFNYTKEMRIACKMAINWPSTYQGITYTLIQRLGNSGNGALGVVGFGISIDMVTKVLSIVAHDGTTLTTKATSWVAPITGIASIDFMVKSDGTGTVSAYADGVFIDSTTGMSTTTTSANTSMFVAVEINSVGTTSTANVIGYNCNLRTFVAHG
jgi:hypothetical protein